MYFSLFILMCTKRPVEWVRNGLCTKTPAPKN